MSPSAAPQKAGKPGKENQKPNEEPAPARFSPEEEAVRSLTPPLPGRTLTDNFPQELLTESNAHKADANALFGSSKYEDALTKYDEAVSVCPNYLDYELALLKSNIAACHLKLEQWKEAIQSATEAISGLEKLEAAETEKAEAEKEAQAARGGDAVGEDDVDEEIVSAGAAKAAPALKEETPSEMARRKRQDDIQRIRTKALLRRARARSELGGWSTLAGAEEDFKTLSTMKTLSAADRKGVDAQLRSLPPRVKAAQETETAEMWGKLKEVCPSRSKSEVAAC
jgi:tetratricopeptide (TPR) repeat protein